MKGNTAQVQALLEQGADTEARDDRGKTAFLWACSQGPPAMVKLLRDAGADATAVDKKGKSALHWAACDDKADNIPLLLQYGLALNATDHSGRTALHWAAAYASRATVELLLKSGADLQAQDNQGRTAHWWAIKQRNQDTADCLAVWSGSPPTATHQTATGGGALRPRGDAEERRVSALQMPTTSLTHEEAVSGVCSGPCCLGTPTRGWGRSCSILGCTFSTQ